MYWKAQVAYWKTQNAARQVSKILRRIDVVGPKQDFRKNYTGELGFTERRHGAAKNTKPCATVDSVRSKGSEAHSVRT